MTKRDDLIDEIVTNLQPFKRGVNEKCATDKTREFLDTLAQQSKAAKKKLLPSAAKTLRSKYRKALKDLIAASERLPPGTLETYMFFAMTPERRQRNKLTKDAPVTFLDVHGTEVSVYDSRLHPLIESRAAGAELLRQLKLLVDVSAKERKKSQDGIMPDVPIKTSVAGHARLLILETSKRLVNGTEEGTYRTIASLLFKAVTGKRTDLKHWCDAEIKRQREHEELSRSFDKLAGREVSET